MGYTTDPATGKRVFNNTPSTTADFNALSDRVEEVTDWSVPTVADLDTIPFPQDGIIRQVAADGLFYGRVTGGWQRINPTMQITGRPGGGPPPAGTHIFDRIHYVEALTSGTGTVPFTFPTAFPAVCAWIDFTTLSGAPQNPVINAGALTRLGATVVFPGSPTANVKFMYRAVGW